MLIEYGKFRIRCLHEPRRSRAFHPAFRDTEARRRTPEGRCEESAQAWSKTEATTRCPRFNRPTLKSFRCRFSHLAGESGISQTLAHNPRNREMEAVGI